MATLRVFVEGDDVCVITYQGEMANGDVCSTLKIPQKYIGSDAGARATAIKIAAVLASYAFLHLYHELDSSTFYGLKLTDDVKHDIRGVVFRVQNMTEKQQGVRLFVHAGYEATLETLQLCISIHYRHELERVLEKTVIGWLAKIVPMIK